MATQSDFKVEVPESITRSIKEPEIEKYEFKKEEVRQRNVLEEIAHRMLDQSKKEIQKPQESIASERTPTVPSKEIQRPQESIAPRREPTPEPAITEYNATNNVFDQQRQRLENSKHLNFVRRILIPESNPLALESKDSSGRSVIETHRMAAEVIDRGQLKGNWIVYPTIIEREQGRLERLSGKDAQDHALRTGEFINFGGKNEDAINFSKNYKLSVPRFNGYFKERWETRQEEKEEQLTATAQLRPRSLSSLSPSTYTGISSEESTGSRFIPPPVQYVLSSYFKGGNKTEKDLGEDVVNELNIAAANAMTEGRNSVNYEDYGTTKRGLSLLALVGASKYADGTRVPQDVRAQLSAEREKMYPKNIIGLTKFVYDISTDPKIQAALTIGGFNIREEENSFFIEDRYNFNTKNKSEDDWYAWIRKKLSNSERMPLLEGEGFTTRINLDDSLLARTTGGGS